MKRTRASNPKPPISSGKSASQATTQSNDDTQLVASFDTDLDVDTFATRDSYLDDMADIQQITGGHYADYS